MPRLVLLALAALVLTRCSPADAVNATIRTEGLQITHDLAYEPGPRHGVDIYRADDAAGARPVVVFFYGGSWNSGSKADYLFVAAALARRGYLVMVPDYRLYPDVRYPAFLDDCAHAVAWAREVAPSWGGDPNRVFVAGHSAGAYNAVMLALDPDLMRAAGSDRKDIAGVIGLAGPYDFHPSVEGEVVRGVFASAPNEADTQAINHVDGRNPPLLLLAGAEDDTVMPRNTRALGTAVMAAHGPVEWKIYPGVGHLGIVAAFAPQFADRAPVVDDIARFIRAVPPVRSTDTRG